MSIRRGAGGLYCCVWNTARVIFLPAELLAADTASWYVNEAGIELSASDAIVLSPVVEGVGAVMVVSEELVRQVEQKYSGITHLSPAQELFEQFHHIRKRNESLSFLVSVGEGVVYVAGFDALARLFLIEAYPFESAADVVFVLDVLLKEEYDWHLYICGNTTRECRKLLHRRFNRHEISEL